jgi:hypothetical protein
MPTTPTTTVHRVLDVSTTHLPRRLGTDGLAAVDGVVADELPYGWLMWVPDSPTKHAISYLTFPRVVLAIQCFARRHGCRFILFDASGAHIDGLRVYDW